jgi:hypothetical protein
VLKVTKRENGEEEWTVKYHLTNPVKITMAEKVELVDRMVKFVGEVTETVGDEVRVMNVTMFPSFVKKCCREHMTDEDVWLLDGLHRDVNRKMKDGLVEKRVRVDTVEWWTLTGSNDDMTLNEIRKRDCLDGDNVHLNFFNATYHLFLKYSASYNMLCKHVIGFVGNKLVDVCE